MSVINMAENYKILQGRTLVRLEEQVQTYIEQGYEPIGGVSTLVADTSDLGTFRGRPTDKYEEVHFQQSMYKRLNASKKEYIGPKKEKLKLNKLYNRGSKVYE